jgi:hypothetical protein
VLLCAIRYAYIPLPKDAPQEIAGSIGASIAILTGLLTVFAIIVPQTAIRISSQTIQLVRTYPFRKRIEIRWDEIERVRWLHGPIEVVAGSKTILIHCSSPRARAPLRKMVTAYLKTYIELEKATVYELRLARQKNWSWPRKILDLLLLFFIVLSIVVALHLFCFMFLAKIPRALIPYVGVAICFGIIAGMPPLLKRYMLHQHEQWKKRLLR